MININFESDLRKISNLKRIRSKQVHNMLDLIIFKLLNHNFFSISLTLLLAFFEDNLVDLKKSWSSVQEVIKQIKNDFINILKDFHLNFCVFSIEAHRDKFSIQKNKQNNRVVQTEKINSIKNYPHIHMFLTFSIFEFDDVEKQKNDVIEVIQKFFINYDVKINKIIDNATSLKNSLKYIIKEVKLYDVDEALNKYSNLEKKLFFFISTSLTELHTYIQNLFKFLKVSYENNYLPYDYGNISSIKDPMYRISLIIEKFINERSYGILGNLVYFKLKEPNSQFTWLPMYPFEKMYFNMMSHYTNKANQTLLFNNMKKIILLQQQTGYLDTLSSSIEECEYIEYSDFYVDLSKYGKLCLKFEYYDNKIFPTSWVESFAYFDHSIFNLMELQDGIDQLKHIFFSEEDLLTYLKCFSNVLYNQKKEKKGLLYLHGPSNSGKSFITEKIMLSLFGIDKIGILNMSDFKFILDQAIDKKVIILNEFKYDIKLRELLLKLFEGSLVEINKKHQNSFSYQVSSFIFATANLSVDEQGMDEAFLNRIYELKTKINKEIPTDFCLIYRSIPLLIFYILYSPFYDSYSSLKNHITTTIESFQKRLSELNDRVNT